MTGNLFHRIREILQEQGFPCDRLSYIHMNRSTGRERNVVILLFNGDDPEPLALAKSVSGNRGIEGLQLEFENLTFLQKIKHEGFKKSVPAPVYLDCADGSGLLIESALQGKRMKDLPARTYLRSDRFQRDVSFLIDWLHVFQEGCGFDYGSGTGGNIEKILKESICNYRNKFTYSDKLDRLMDEVAGILGDAKLPLVVWHGDFCSANILVSEAPAIRVIDWEHPLEKSWPLGELLYFMSSLRYVPGMRGTAGMEQNYRSLFFSRTRLTELFRSSCRRYLRMFDMDLSLIVPLSVISWVCFANRKMAEMIQVHGTTGNEVMERHLPLTMIKDNYCLNLEILAEKTESYILK